MGRYNSGSSSNYVENATPPILAVPLTIACRANLAVTTSCTLAGLINSGATGNYFSLTIGESTATRVAASQSDTGGDGIGETTVGITAGQWFDAVGVYTGNASRTAYINGGSSGTNTASKSAPTGINRTDLGIFRNAGGTFGPANGTLSFIAFWNAALTAGEIWQMYSRRLPPWSIRPESLIAVYETNTDTGVFALKNVNPWRNRGVFDIPIVGTLPIDRSPWVFDPAGAAARNRVWSFGRTTGAVSTFTKVVGSGGLAGVGSSIVGPGGLVG